jgi:hypothetical protein
MRRKPKQKQFKQLMRKFLMASCFLLFNGYSSISFNWSGFKWSGLMEVMDRTPVSAVGCLYGANPQVSVSRSDAGSCRAAEAVISGHPGKLSREEGMKVPNMEISMSQLFQSNANHTVYEKRCNKKES